MLEKDTPSRFGENESEAHGSEDTRVENGYREPSDETAANHAYTEAGQPAGDSSTAERDDNPGLTEVGEGSKGSVPKSGVDTSSVANVIASDEALTQYFVTHVSNMVNAELKRREEKRHRFWDRFIIVIGVIGFAGFSALLNLTVKNAVRDEVKTTSEGLKSEFTKQLDNGLDATEKNVTANLQEKIGIIVKGETSDLRKDMDEQLAYQQLAYLVLRVEDPDTKSFSNQERDSIMDLMMVVSESERLRSRTDFVVLLEKVIDIFVSANIHEYILRLTETYQKETASQDGIVFSLAQHYGKFIVGHSRPVDEVDPRVIAEFDRMEAAANIHNVPEIILPYRLMIDFRRAGNRANEVTRDYLDSVNYYRLPSEKATFHRLLILNTDVSLIANYPTKELENLVSICNSFREAHYPEIAEQLQQPEVQEALVDYARSGSPAVGMKIIEELERADGYQPQ